MCEVDINLIFIYTIIGVLAGFMSGMFGIGGGSIRIPLLNFAGLPLITAFGINLFVIPFSSAVGATSQREYIDKKYVYYIILGGSLGSVIGAVSVGLVPTLALAFIFFITAFLSVILIYADKFAPNISEKINPNRANMLIYPFLLNLITGMRGGSGGSLFPPFFRAMKFDIHKAIATSLFVTVFTSIIATVIYWQRGNIEYISAICVLIGSILGAWLGSKLSLKSKPNWLQLGLSILIIFLALLTVLKTLLA